MEEVEMTIQVVEQSRPVTPPTIIYPDSDGEPMGETEFHVIAILHLYDTLRHFFRDRVDVYVAANMFLYYEEGNPDARKAPDVMVIKGVDKHKRRTFKTWEEHAAPWVVFVITSKSSWLEDLVSKSALYAWLGVVEYFLFDPLREYLDQSLQGFRLTGKEYTPIPAHADGSLFSAELGVWLRPEGDLLRIIDPQTGKAMPALDEAILQAEQEAQRAEQEAQRADAAEAEITRLRALVERLRGEAVDDPGGENRA
jgi:Uma2 family endonuclease